MRASVEDPDWGAPGRRHDGRGGGKLLILKTLEATGNNKTKAAEILAISLKTLHNKLKEYGSVSAEATADKEEEELR
jgi:transcriptional regulator with GAF, ATPase, and Fis domain